MYVRPCGHYVEMSRRIICGDAAHTSVFHTAVCVCVAIGRTIGRRLCTQIIWDYVSGLSVCPVFSERIISGTPSWVPTMKLC